MDLEFHYYITYLTALAAGIVVTDAYKIAYSAQFVDDNLISYKISYDDKCENTVPTQTVNYFDPFSTKIWQKIHFIAGDYKSANIRKDKLQHKKCVTPNSKKAKQLLENAIESKDHYRIGIASHAYVDTWAHQDFVGEKSHFNNLNFMERSVGNVFASIGHADAMSKPDRINLIWRDTRLIYEIIYNKHRFLDAAKHLYKMFCTKYNSGKYTCKEEDFINDINWAIGKETKRYFPCINVGMKKRIKKYEQLARKYSGYKIPIYNSKAWIDQSIVRDKFGICRWKGDYKNSHFYKFNQAAKFILK